MRAAEDFRAALPMRKAVKIFSLVLLLGLAKGVPLAAQAGGGSSDNSTASSEQGIRGKKLILKDGTTVIVRKYQIVGNRVRFYSVERSDWEEIPSSLVDWKATHKAASQAEKQEKQAIALAHQVDLEEHPGSLNVSGGLDLPPGVLLPGGDGMYAYNGHSILALKADLAKSRLNKGRFVAKLISPIPVVATRYTISLSGKRAKTRIADSEPVFYFRTSRGSHSKFLLIRARVKGKEREIGFLSENLGQKKTEAQEIPLNVQTLDRDAYRITATQDLSPGEYVLAEMLPAAQTIDLYVWDFGIDRAPSKSKTRK